MRLHPAEALCEGAIDLLRAAGLEHAHALHLAQTVVAADLLGYSSHGLALLPRYLDELLDGRMTKSGEPAILRDNGSSLTIDGRSLPGPAVVHFALDQMLDRTASHGAVTAVIRDSMHIGCLSAYLERATSRGQLILIMSSNPSAGIVAPFGGARGVYSPNPLACGIPTEGDPILIDMSMSSISANRVREFRERGEDLPNDYLLDAEGRPSRDPNVLVAKPPGTIRPFGGDDLGYKGFALGVMIEAFTSGLAGVGRSDAPTKSSNTVFLLLTEPGAFGGADFLAREMSHLADASRASGPPGQVRVPGGRAHAHRRQALRDGILLDPGVAQALVARAEKLGVATIFSNP